MTPDGALVRGILWTPPAGTPWKTAVVLTHPRGDFSVHYACPLLAAAGYAVLGFGTRYLNNDTDCLHEALRRPTSRPPSPRCAGAAREARRAARQQRRRLADGAGAEGDAAAATASIAIAAHPGEGVFMMQVIDPSVADEGDPLSSVPELDMYDPRQRLAAVARAVPLRPRLARALPRRAARARRAHRRDRARGDRGVRAGDGAGEGDRQEERTRRVAQLAAARGAPADARDPPHARGSRRTSISRSTPTTARSARSSRSRIRSTPTTRGSASRAR